MIDKIYCLSSYLAMRYIVDDNKDFFQTLKHQQYHQNPLNHRIFVGSVEDTDVALKNQFKLLRHEKLGIMLSGGMDSAILASYMPKGADAYTFRFLDGKFQSDELERAKYYAQIYQLNLHYVDINWSVVESCVEACMRSKGAPVHSIEPQLYYAAQLAKADGISMMIVGDGADYVFGGMDGLLSKDWGFDEFYQRAIYINPKDVLVNATDMRDVFEPYRIGSNSIDYIRFYDEKITDESYASYENAFHAADMPYYDPYERLKLLVPLDLDRIRNGESKYIIRELFKRKYTMPVPQKLPMPRPVDEYFKNWEGPQRAEFRKDIPMDELTGNQKWQLWCAELFLNMFD
ncbi:MAG: asparagine synthase [Prevotellaceae bacterium]|nr:asparagine synthase [Candidatus Colivivens equi]